jgi:hypothetical protein
MRGFSFSNGDFVFNPSGYFEKVTGAEKVRRDMFKRLASDKEFDTNKTNYYRYNPNYGTKLNNKKIFANLSRANVLPTINSLINEALQDAVASQKIQTNMSPDELINYVDFFTIYDSNNPALAKCTITVSLLTGQTLNLGTFTQEL